MSYGKRKNLCNLIKLLALLLIAPLACFLFKAATAGWIVLSVILLALAAAGWLYRKRSGWVRDWDKLLEQNRYDEALESAEELPDKIWRGRDHTGFIAQTQLFAGHVGEFMRYSQSLLQEQPDEKHFDEALLPLLVLRNTVFFLSDEYHAITAVDAASLARLHPDLPVGKLQKMIKAFLDGRHDEALEWTNSLRSPMWLYTCVTAVVQCKVHDMRGDLLQAAFYKQQALETATSMELCELVAQKLGAVSEFLY